MSFGQSGVGLDGPLESGFGPGPIPRLEQGHALLDEFSRLRVARPSPFIFLRVATPERYEQEDGEAAKLVEIHAGPS